MAFDLLCQIPKAVDAAQTGVVLYPQSALAEWKKRKMLKTTPHNSRLTA